MEGQSDLPALSSLIIKQVEAGVFMKEIWKDIPGYEGLYQASSLGRIRSLDREKWNGYCLYLNKGRVMKQSVINSGREVVSLCVNSKVKRMLVYRLVAMAFIPNPNNYPQVNHIDGNPRNNRADNLEWCNQSGNEIHKLYTLGHTNSSLLYPPKKVIRVQDGTVFRSLSEASRETGIPAPTLYYDIKNKIADRYGNHWEYVI